MLPAPALPLRDSVNPQRPRIGVIQLLSPLKGQNDQLRLESTLAVLNRQGAALLGAVCPKINTTCPRSGVGLLLPVPKGRIDLLWPELTALVLDQHDTGPIAAVFLEIHSARPREPPETLHQL